jgi:hypothetical protein
MLRVAERARKFNPEQDAHEDGRSQAQGEEEDGQHGELLKTSLPSP